MELVFSVIIPFKGTVALLERLMVTIPERPDMEILIIDNNEMQGRLSSNHFDRASVRILYSELGKGAGHARNVGLQAAKGDWILFADADDFFHPGAFDIFYSYRNFDADIIYFCADSCYSDSLKPAERGLRVCSLVDQYCEKKRNAIIRLRYEFLIPSCKMIKRKLIKAHNIGFEEIKVADDVFFSVVSGYWAEKVHADRSVVYCLTITPGSLTTIRSKEYLKITFQTCLKSNVFLKQYDFSGYQLILIFYVLKAIRYGGKGVWELYRLARHMDISIWTGWRQLPYEIFYRIKRKF